MRIDADTAANALGLQTGSARDSEQSDRAVIGILRFQPDQRFEIDIPGRWDCLDGKRRLPRNTDTGSVVSLDVHGSFPQIGEIDGPVESRVAWEGQFRFQSRRGKRRVRLQAEQKCFERWRLSRCLENCTWHAEVLKQSKCLRQKFAAVEIRSAKFESVLQILVGVNNKL